MISDIKIFSRLYVAKRKIAEDCILGFMTPYEENSAGKKRQETANNWAKPNDIYNYVKDENGKSVRTLIEKRFPIAPEIYDNVSMDGFEICREVKRTYWGGGNVVWRILDPRGFELEISSSNMAKILTYATIEAGSIKSKCIWGRIGSNNILIPDGCPDYQNIILNAENRNKKENFIKPSTITIGSEVTHNGEKYTYYGVWYFATPKKEILKRYVLTDTDNKVFVVGELKATNVVESNISVNLNFVIDLLSKKAMIDSASGLFSYIYFSQKKFKIEDLQIVLTEVDSPFEKSKLERYSFSSEPANCMTVGYSDKYGLILTNYYYGNRAYSYSSPYYSKTYIKITSLNAKDFIFEYPYYAEERSSILFRFDKMNEFEEIRNFHKVCVYLPSETPIIRDIFI